MSELVTTLQRAVAELAAADRGCKRFGAATHRYELTPTLSAAEVGRIEATLGEPLPDDYRDFVLEVAGGGAGPAYGLFTTDRAVNYAIRQRASTSSGEEAPWTLALPIAHYGCGYAVVMPLDGPARGQIWLHAKAIDVVATIRPSFTSYYIDWVDRLARNAMPDSFVPPDACALPAALSGYFGVWERRLGLEAGSLADRALRDAISNLGPGAIELAAEAAQPLFEPGDRVDPCLTCARLVASLADQGLDQAVIAAGMPPLPMRARD